MGVCCLTDGLKQELCDHLEGWDGVGGGREAQETEDPHVAVADAP